MKSPQIDETKRDDTKKERHGDGRKNEMKVWLREGGKR